MGEPLPIFIRALLHIQWALAYWNCGQVCVCPRAVGRAVCASIWPWKPSMCPLVVVLAQFLLLLNWPAREADLSLISPLGVSLVDSNSKWSWRVFCHSSGDSALGCFPIMNWNREAPIYILFDFKCVHIFDWSCMALIGNIWLPLSSGCACVRLQQGWLGWGASWGSSLSLCAYKSGLWAMN